MARLKHNSLFRARRQMRRMGISGVIAYEWRGLLCLRTRPVRVRNPRTPLQQRNRALFAQKMRLASDLRELLGDTMLRSAREQGLRPANLFFVLNIEHIALNERGMLEVDWHHLQVSDGHVAEVQPLAAAEGEGRVEARFTSLEGEAYDAVRLAFWNAERAEVRWSAAVPRCSGSVEGALPTEWRGEAVCAWLIVQDAEGQFSPSAFVGWMKKEASATYSSHPLPSAEGLTILEADRSNGVLPTMGCLSGP